MARTDLAQKNAEIRSKSLHAAARLFLERGYTAATMRDIADAAGVNVSAMIRAVGNKETIMCELVHYVLEGQFQATTRLLDGVTEDKILFYATETTLQLYMAESDEHIREIYAAAYSLPESSALIMRIIAGKLEDIFGAYQPNLESKDFYELEIASGGIIRGYMTIPCDMYFTMERKVRRFLEASLRIYQVPEEKIQEAVAFVSRFDYSAIAQGAVESMLSALEQGI